MKISVCIAATRATTVDAAIASIRHQTWTDWELVLVGQGDDPALAAVGKAAALSDARVHYVHLDRRGLSLARNAGIRAATGDIIAMTDDDCEAREDWLATLGGIFAAEPAVGLVGGALLAPSPAHGGPASCPCLEPADALYDPIAADRQAPAGWDWIGGNFAIRRRAVERVGMFDECLGAGAVFPAAEDTDYKLRMERIGIKMRSTPRSVVYHTHGHRYGARAVLRSSRAYARGNAALAAKLTLMGDPRGREWLEETRRECLGDWRTLTSGRRPHNPLRYLYFARAYAECLRQYRVDPVHHILYAIPAKAETPR
ncbi:MAG TPA: glycosyltransferase [Ktedonobacterales bacterium]